MDSSRPADWVSHRRVDHQLARKSTMSAISEMCCRSQRDHVHRQGWRTGPADDAPGWSQISGEWVVYEASLGIAFSARRTPARFILISEVASSTVTIGLEEAGKYR